MLNGNISRDIHIRSMWNLSYNIKFNYAGLRRLYRCQFFNKSSISALSCDCVVFRQFFFHSLFSRRLFLIVIFQAGVNIFAPVCRELAAISLLTSLISQSMEEASAKKTMSLRQIHSLLQISSEIIFRTATHRNSGEIMLTSTINLCARRIERIR